MNFQSCREAGRCSTSDHEVQVLKLDDCAWLGLLSGAMTVQAGPTNRSHSLTPRVYVLGKPPWRRQHCSKHMFVMVLDKPWCVLYQLRLFPAAACP